MGPSGAGKSTLGAELAARLSAPFIDADDFCPAAARAKMSAGVPLGDSDRLPWLQCLNHELLTRGRPRVVLACSAHKESYRALLFDGVPAVCIIWLQGDFALLHRRMTQRHGHFMPASLLASQIALMEKPPLCLSLDVSRPLSALAEEAMAYVKDTFTRRPSPLPSA